MNLRLQIERSIRWVPRHLHSVEYKKDQGEQRLSHRVLTGPPILSDGQRAFSAAATSTKN